MVKAVQNDINERAQHFLKALIERYIRDGQPVGSRTLAKDAGLDLSPATVRNVMADLEQPTGGEISVNGMTPAEARKARAYGYVFQAAGLYPWRTIERNIRLHLPVEYRQCPAIGSSSIR